MKFLIIIISTIYLLNSCAQQTNKMIAPEKKSQKISSQSEDFDINSFVEEIEKNIDSIQKKIVFSTAYKGGHISPQAIASITHAGKNKLDREERSAYDTANSKYYVFKELDKYTLYKWRDFDRLLFLEESTWHDSCYTVVKEFYNSGRIKSKYIRYNTSLKGGIGYEYDKQGQLESVINYEKGYKFTLQDVISYLIGEGVKLPTGYQGSPGPYPTIRRIEEHGEKRWHISYRKFEDKLYFYEDVLDGQTGNRIRRQKDKYVEWSPPILKE